MSDKIVIFILGLAPLYLLVMTVWAIDYRKQIRISQNLDVHQYERISYNRFRIVELKVLRFDTINDLYLGHVAYPNGQWHTAIFLANQPNSVWARTAFRLNIDCDIHNMLILPYVQITAELLQTAVPYIGISNLGNWDIVKYAGISEQQYQCRESEFMNLRWLSETSIVKAIERLYQIYDIGDKDMKIITDLFNNGHVINIRRVNKNRDIQFQVSNSLLEKYKSADSRLGIPCFVIYDI